ncbi:bifunctional diguanylate cyclase/phosphodiesterase [Thioalkalivibrio sp. ALE11]|uniref:putative bifunctional diguanylate cyclase/phosphodiesterase n=1 Tax=Thioalkalivibrio sp. ALE11 TaxID=1265494 RepID=UPI00036F08E6|nr:EAL domain-containing protein [Thioalkalivibrio sp. ALE11]
MGSLQRCFGGRLGRRVSAVVLLGVLLLQALLLGLLYRVEPGIPTMPGDGAAGLPVIAGAVLLALMAAAAMLMLMDRLVLLPIQRLRRAMQGAAGDPEHPLRYRSGMQGGDELARLGTAFDVLQQRSAETLERLAEREAALGRWAEEEIRSMARFPDENVFPVLRADRAGVLQYANPASAELLAEWGIQQGDGLPEHWRDTAAAALDDGEYRTLEVRLGERWFQIHVVPVTDAGYVNLYGTDITERKTYEDALLQRQTQDETTGLANLPVFQDRLQQVLQQARLHAHRAAVVFLGMSGFQHINGMAGRRAGDAVLAVAAQRLQAEVPADHTVARVGGDVFGVVVPAFDDPGELSCLAERLAGALAQPYEVNGRPLESGAHAGIASYPAAGEEAATLIRNADLAMAGAKREGGARVRFFSAEMNAAVEHHNRRLRELRTALAEDQFEAFYQVQVDSVTGRATGAEALVRWHHPREGRVSPGDFIPVAEAGGLIGALGDRVLEQAVGQVARWRAAGWEAVTVAVNVSPLQLADDGLVERVAGLLETHGVPGGALELEVTESAMMADVERMGTILGRLRELGVGIAVDDFGTGYSSLAYLKTLPVDKIKIDRAFVRDLPDDPHDRAVCSAVVALGAGLGLRVLAEGAEEAGQVAALGELGCRSIQGFHYGHPVPAGELEARWRAG